MSRIIYLLISILCCSTALSAQDKELAGIVFDKDTKNRLSRVTITNLRTSKYVFNNAKGEFSIAVKEGDQLIISLENYLNDTLVVHKQSSLIVYLRRAAIPLAQVIVRDSVLSPQQNYEQAKRDFNKIYRLGNNKDILNVGPSGVGLGIDAIWSAFSKEGKDARKLMEIMERDYQHAFVEKIFNKELVSRVSGLKGDKLVVFMFKYRPSYNFVVQAKEYDLVNYIKISATKFKIHPYYDDIGFYKTIKQE